MRKRNRRNGFTLIEATVTLAVLSLLSVAAISVYRFGQRSYEQILHYHDADAEVRETQRFLRNSLTGAYPLGAASTAESYGYGVEGSQTEIEFSALAPSGSAIGGHLRYHVFVERLDDGSRNLVVRATIDRNGFDAVRTRDRVLIEEALLPDIADIHWSYLDAQRLPGQPTNSVWRNNWVAQRQLPAAVRLDVDFPAGDDRRWPEFVVATRLTDDAQCEFDAVAQACRGRR